MISSIHAYYLLKFGKCASLLWHYSKNPYVCSLHFDPTDIISKGGIKYLKPGTIPMIPASIFLANELVM